MIKVEELFPIMQEAFQNQKTFLMPIKGTSMQPLWHTGDKVELSRIETPKKKDVLFYQRHDGSYVLHRLWKIREDTYFMIGDHQLVLEEISKEQCFAKVVAYYTKKGKRKQLKGFSYRIYCFSLHFRWIRRIYAKWY